MSESILGSAFQVVSLGSALDMVQWLWLLMSLFGRSFNWACGWFRLQVDVDLDLLSLHLHGVLAEKTLLLARTSRILRTFNATRLQKEVQALIESFSFDLRLHSIHLSFILGRWSSTHMSRFFSTVWQPDHRVVLTFWSVQSDHCPWNTYPMCCKWLVRHSIHWWLRNWCVKQRRDTLWLRSWHVAESNRVWPLKRALTLALALREGVVQNLF